MVFAPGGQPSAQNRVFNIGDSRPVGLMDMIGILERALGREAVKHMRPMQPGDVTATFADISRLNALCGYAPKVTLEAGLPKFVEWYRNFSRDSAPPGSSPPHARTILYYINASMERLRERGEYECEYERRGGRDGWSG